VKKTIELLSKKYHWSRMIKYVKFYIKTCDVCQRTKTFRHFFYDDLQSFLLSQDSWQEIIMNFITNLSSSKRSNDVYDFVLVIINRYIKMTFYISVTKKITIVELINIIFDHVMLKYDVSKNVVSNREFVFTNAYWANICYHMKMKRRLNIIFHSQTNEQIERQNQNLEHFLRMFCFEKQTKWVKYLFLIEFVYQNNVQFIIECNLFFCMYDYNSEIRYESKNDIIMNEMLVATKRVKNLIEYRQKLIERWQKAANAQVKYYNRKHIALTFKTENLIMLFIKNIKLKNSSQKFSHKFIESFCIVETMNKQIYRLILFSFYRIHDVFHVFYLKSYKRQKNDNIISEYSSSELLDDDEVNEVEEILQKKISKKIIYYLIKWKSWSEKYNEWIAEKNMNALDLLQKFDEQTKRRRKIK
jgi:sulfur relay (sulfurtransferase) DsrC/TusE family protein